MLLSRLLTIPLIWSLWFVPIAAIGQETADNAAREEYKARLEEWIDKQQQEGNAPAQPGNTPRLLAPTTSPEVKLSPANAALQQEAIGQYFKHVMESNAHQLNVFRWQLLSAKVIFVTVILLVISGIYFAAVQFHHGLKSGGQSGEQTEVEATLKGIKVSSPVLGVIILTISLAFFYLYLVHVYPIEFVGG